MFHVRGRLVRKSLSPERPGPKKRRRQEPPSQPRSIQMWALYSGAHARPSSRERICGRPLPGVARRPAGSRADVTSPLQTRQTLPSAERRRIRHNAAMRCRDRDGRHETDSFPVEISHAWMKTPVGAWLESHGVEQEARGSGDGVSASRRRRSMRHAVHIPDVTLQPVPVARCR